MKIRCSFILLAIFTSIFIFSSVTPLAAITVQYPYVFTNNRNSSGGVLGVGWRLTLGEYVTSSDPTFSPQDVNVTAIKLGPDPVTINVPFWAYDYAHGYGYEYSYGTLYNSSYNGQYQLTATYRTDPEVISYTSILDDIRQIPLASSLNVSTGAGTLTPTLSWTGFNSTLFPEYSNTTTDYFYLRVRVRNSDGTIAWDSSNISDTDLSTYPIPAGVLNKNQRYFLEIMLNHVDYDDITHNFSLENRSETLLDYSTAPIPEALWLLGSGLLGLVGIRRLRS